MAANDNRKRVRELKERIVTKREELGRLRGELSTLIAERKALKEKMDKKESAAKK